MTPMQEGLEEALEYCPNNMRNVCMNALLLILHVIYLHIADILFGKKFVTGHAGLVRKLKMKFISLKRLCRLT